MRVQFLTTFLHFITYAVDLLHPGEAKSRGWVVVGRVCLKIKKDVYMAVYMYNSSLGARSKFAIARSRINLPEPHL